MFPHTRGHRQNICIQYHNDGRELAGNKIISEQRLLLEIILKFQIAHESNKNNEICDTILHQHGNVFHQDFFQYFPTTSTVLIDYRKPSHSQENLEQLKQVD